MGRVGGSCQPDWLWDRGCFPGPTTSFEGLCRIWETDHQRRSVGSCQPESLVSCFKVCTSAIEKELSEASESARIARSDCPRASVRVVDIR